MAGANPVWLRRSSRTLANQIGFTNNGQYRMGTDQAVKDLVFADEILAGGGWLVDKTRDFFDPLKLESRCCRSGIDDDN